MRTYYFDRKNGLPVRDKYGLEFATRLEAINYSKGLAQQIRSKQKDGDSDLCVVVIDESGAEIHREQVYPEAHG